MSLMATAQMEEGSSRFNEAISYTLSCVGLLHIELKQEQLAAICFYTMGKVFFYGYQWVSGN